MFFSFHFLTFTSNSFSNAPFACIIYKNLHLGIPPLVNLSNYVYVLGRDCLIWRLESCLWVLVYFLYVLYQSIFLLETYTILLINVTPINLKNIFQMLYLKQRSYHSNLIKSPISVLICCHWQCLSCAHTGMKVCLECCRNMLNNLFFNCPVVSLVLCS